MILLLKFLFLVESHPERTAIERSPAVTTAIGTPSETRKRPASPLNPTKDNSPNVNSASSTTSPADDVYIPKRRREAHKPSKAPQKLVTHTNGSMSTPVNVDTDWENVFGVVTDGSAALKYHAIFEEEYPIYRKCYEELAKVSAEFNELKHRFDKAPLGSSTQKEVSFYYYY